MHRLALESKTEDEEAVEKAYLADLSKELKEAAGDAMSEDDEEDEDDDGVEDTGKAATAGVSSKKRSAAETDLEDTERMKDIMMTRKNRKFYERIKRAQAGKQERNEVLETRKRAVQDGDKKTPVKK